LWFHPGLDRLFVSSSKVRDQAIANRVPPDKVTLTGIPVDPRIAREKRSQTEIRTSLGWDPALITILAVGSRRVNNLLGYLAGIDRPGSPVQLVIVTGGDDVSFLKAQARSWSIPVHLYHFVENVPEMMLAADLLVTKAGGLVIAEGLSCGLPIILIDSLPGQETGNIRYICENQAGAALQAPEEMPRVLDGWLENDQARLKQLAQNAKTIGKPEAAGRIAEIIWQTVSSTN
jgi:UDP-N-acetylglucosamine:LPS N-acetylglucosamine transferase